ncbi:MAG: ribosomal RNA small subunit methyltransferase A [Candidatus Omnitrophica bacterium]|nr:ribosomal RNA small subunit methyltransferase A [Candidatus Omnitrophota bacterium]
MFFAKKSLGQNFLVDTKMTERIIDACDLKPDETVLEVGPGQGALTRAIAPRVKHVIAVEADRVLAEKLRQDFSPEVLTVYHEDILKFDLSLLPGKVKVIGNLPYNISTPILTRVIEGRAHFSSLFMTVQYEFGMRLMAKTRTKDYSSLTCFVNLYARPEMLFKVPNKCFRPVPKVQSCFMRLDLLQEPAAAVNDEGFFDKMVRQAFLQRRKTLLNALAGFASSKESLLAVFDRAGVSSQARAEELSVADMARLANAFSYGT